GALRRVPGRRLHLHPGRGTACGGESEPNLSRARGRCADGPERAGERRADAGAGRARALAAASIAGFRASDSSWEVAQKPRERLGGAPRGFPGSVDVQHHTWTSTTDAGKLGRETSRPSNSEFQGRTTRCILSRPSDRPYAKTPRAALAVAGFPVVRSALCWPAPGPGLPIESRREVCANTKQIGRAHV